MGTMDAGRDSVPAKEVPGSLSTPPSSTGETPQATGTRLIANAPNPFAFCTCPDCTEGFWLFENRMML